MKTDKKEILAELQSMRESIARIETDINKPDKGFEVGDILKYTDGAIVYKTGINTGYGFNYFGEWDDDKSDHWTFDSKSSLWTKTTTQEWKAVLEKQAEKLGIKYGVTVERDWLNFNYKKQIIDKGIKGFHYNQSDDRLYLNGYIIYQEGKWATVVEDTTQAKIDQIHQLADFIKKGTELLNSLKNK